MADPRMLLRVQAGVARGESLRVTRQSIALGFRCCLGLLLGFCSGVQVVLAAPDRVEIETAYMSRNVYVPATLVIPLAAKDHQVPLVIMAHGHGGTRNEAGGFRSMATMLGKAGIASIRMDFPGCGDNPDPFTENNLGNMLADIAGARSFALDELPVDPKRVAILGYSMGGRLAVLAAEGGEYSAIALWSPAGLNGAKSMHSFVGGKNSWRHLKSEANRDDVAHFITPWGGEQLLGKKWFHDLEESNPEEAIRKFTGPVLVIHGLADRHIIPENSKALIKAARSARSVEPHFIKDADHGLGFYTGSTEISGEVIRLTVDFLTRNLLEAPSAEEPDP